MGRDVLSGATNHFRGIVVDPASVPDTPAALAAALPGALAAWRDEGLQVVWLELSAARAALIPVATNAGFAFHHTEGDRLVLTYRLAAGAFVPPYASHYVGAGGVVVNARRELLVVWERTHRRNGRRYLKLPGGALHQGEHLAEGVMREVFEETGIETRFESLVCFRHWHGYRFGKSDIYFVCRLSPLTERIQIQEEEIAECLWMPVADYLSSDEVGSFNKRIVEAALDHYHLVPAYVDGYSADEREVFLPGDLVAPSLRVPNVHTSEKGRAD